MSEITPIEWVVKKTPAFAKYGFRRDDVDVTLALQYCIPPAGSSLLVIGAHDEATANYFADTGVHVTGVDLRSYDSKLPPCNYRYIQKDFCSMDRVDFAEMNPARQELEFKEFDACLALSCIEHFGMGAYKEGIVHRYYDVIAMRKVWELLRIGGRAYVTVPFGSHFIEFWPHWRVYDLPSAKERLVQDFSLVHMDCCTASPLMFDGRERKAGETLTLREANAHLNMPPHVQTILVLEKADTNRASPY